MPRIILDCFCKRRAIFDADLLLNKNIEIIPNSKRDPGHRGRKPDRRWLAYFLGPLIFLFLSYSIYRQVVRQPDWRGSLDQIFKAIKGPGQWKLWVVLALMPVNWGIEARKWQLALRPVGGIAYRNAFRAVFTGVTLASFTPNRMGEYLGRMLYVEQGKRISSIALTIISSMAQLLVTLALGLAGTFYLRHHLYQESLPGRQALEFWLNVFLFVVFLLLLSLTFIYFRLSWLIGILGKLPGVGKYLQHVKVLDHCDATVLLRILSLSFFRYLVFILQYALVFPLFGVYLGIGQAGAGMSVVFLVMAVVPTFTFLTELGLRWGASIQVLELFGAGAVGILASSLAIWLINLIIPALIGSLLILSIKLFKSK
jgi:Lysylphosphatidylglycerol synthase TM region